MIDTLPDALFQTRVRNDRLGEPNPFEWQERSIDERFKDRQVVLFALPGAFTPGMGMRRWR